MRGESRHQMQKLLPKATITHRSTFLFTHQLLNPPRPAHCDRFFGSPGSYDRADTIHRVDVSNKSARIRTINSITATFTQRATSSTAVVRGMRLPPLQGSKAQLRSLKVSHSRAIVIPTILPECPSFAFGQPSTLMDASIPSQTSVLPLAPPSP